MTVTAMLELVVADEDLQASYDAVHEALTDTRAFDGCLSVDVVHDVANPAHLMIIEKWESMEQDAAYRAWRAGPGKAVAMTEATVSRTLTKYVDLPDV